MNDELIAEIKNLIKRSEERLEFAEAINKFSDVAYFENTIATYKQCLTALQSEQEVKDMVEYAKHIHVNSQKDDICLECGHDLRHPIHNILFRYPAKEA